MHFSRLLIFKSKTFWNRYYYKGRYCRYYYLNFHLVVIYSLNIDRFRLCFFSRKCIKYFGSHYSLFENKAHCINACAILLPTVDSLLWFIYNIFDRIWSYLMAASNKAMHVIRINQNAGTITAFNSFFFNLYYLYSLLYLIP